MNRFADPTNVLIIVAGLVLLACVAGLLWVAWINRRPVDVKPCPGPHNSPCTRPHLEMPRLQRVPATHAVGPPATEVRWATTAEMSADTKPDVVLFLDPPYLNSTRRGLDRQRPKDYAQDTSTEEDHRRYARAAHACVGTVLLFGYDSPLYDELYADWYRVSREVSVPSSVRAGCVVDRAVEVIWSNRPPGAQLDMFAALAEEVPA